jgi:hypothetical protein
VIAAVSFGRLRKTWAVLLLIAATFLVPAVSQAAIVTKEGFIWQGRYTLAIIVMLMLACGFVLDAAGLRYPPRALRTATVILIAFLGLGHLAAFANTLKRYVIGSDTSFQFMFTRPSWQPPLRWETLTVLFILTLIAACILVARLVFRPEPAESHDELEEREPEITSARL